MISTRFVSSTILYTIGGAMPMASGFILMPVYLNNLSKSDNAYIIIFQILILLFQTIGILNIDVSTQAYFFEYKDKPEKLKRFIGTLVCNMLIIGAALIVFWLISGSFFYRFFFPETSYLFFPFGFIPVVIGYCFTFFKSYSNFLIIRQRPLLFFFLNFLNFALTIGFTLLFLELIPNSIVGPIYGRTIPILISFGITLILYFKEFGIYFDKIYTKKIVSYSYPLLINVIIIWITANIDRVFIGASKNSLNLINYDTALKCALVLEFLLTGFTNSIYPRIMSMWKERNLAESSEQENRYHHAFVVLTLLSIATLNFLSPIVIPLLIRDKEYLNAINLIPLLSLQFLFRGFYNLYLYPLYYFKRTKALPKVFIITGIVQVISSWLLIRHWGEHGAIAAIFLNRITQIILLKFESQKVFKFKFNKIKLLALPLLYFLMVIGGEVVFKTTHSIPLYLTEFVILIVLILSIYRSELFFLIKNRKAHAG